VARKPRTTEIKRMATPAQAYNTVMSDAKLVVVKSFGNRPEAELAKGALQAAGIQAMTQADTVGGMREHIAWSGAGFQVFVREEDSAAALDVLAATAENNSDEPDGDSRSPRRRFT
jgi:hypothetical protein